MSDRTELATRNEPAGTAVATPTDTEAAAAQARTAPAVDVSRIATASRCTRTCPAFRAKSSTCACKTAI